MLLQRKERAKRPTKSISVSDPETEKEEGPGPKVEKVLTKAKHTEILKTQKVSSRRVFDPVYSQRLGMR